MPFPDQIERWRALVRKYAPADLQGDAGFEAIALATLMAESNGNPGAVGDEGASVGLFQLHERGLGQGLSRQQRSDPDTNASRAIPQLAAAYKQTRGDPAETYRIAINPGAEHGGPQITSVMSAYRQGASGGPKVMAKPVDQVAPAAQGGTMAGETYDAVGRGDVAKPARADDWGSSANPMRANAEAISLVQGELKRADKARTDAQTRLDALIEKSQETEPDEDGRPQPSSASYDAAKAIPAAQTAATKANDTYTGLVGRLADLTKDKRTPAQEEFDQVTTETKKFELAEKRKAANAATTPEEKKAAELAIRKLELDIQKAERALDPKTEAMTPYQSGSLDVSRQNAGSSALNAAASWLSAQVSQGRLSFDKAKTVFDYIADQGAPVEEGGKLYMPGRSPSNPHRKTLGLSEQPYRVIDAAGFFGEPGLNQHVRGPYPFGAGLMAPEEYSQRTAGGFVPGGAQPAPAAPSFGAQAQQNAQPAPQMPASAPEPTQPTQAMPVVANAPAFGTGEGDPARPGFGRPDAVAFAQSQMGAATDDMQKIIDALLAKGFDPVKAREAAGRMLGIDPLQSMAA